VAAQRHAEQVVAEQRVRLPADLGRAEQQVHDGQQRPLQQKRREAGQHAGALPLVERGHLGLQPLRLPGVLLAQGLKLRREPGQRGLAALTAQAERHEQGPDGHGETDDGGGGGRAAQDWGEDSGKSNDEVIGGVHRDAKETGHDKTAFQRGWLRVLEAAAGSAG
jgi:hypothetical protein